MQVDLFCGESDSGWLFTKNGTQYIELQYFVTVSTSMEPESEITQTVFTPMLSTFVLGLDAKVEKAVFAAS